ncbi:DegT/DnrJ/EryC1/StrS family aminotransferase [Sphingorhabdus arenilitoris]|uniref:DegT/DnrJ/EryC1/StrS family aminotransferase n=1 Tax=Sphingorhabdus arenilitoris TaxID=1490041 RepID=A0ABV8RGE3_9SPHN
MQFIDLAAQQQYIRKGLDKRIADVLSHGGYIMGPEVGELEMRLAEFCGVKHALGCANGTDALQLAMMAMGVMPGDAIFCPSFTFASTAEIVPMMGATPIFVDIVPDTFNICVKSLERAIAAAKELGLRPTGVVAVDLFGLPADYDAIEAIASAEGLWVLADSAQGFGADYKGRKTGSIGKMATTSFFPAKPLGCYGDGGAIFTNDDDLADLVKSYRVHGKGSHKYDNERVGINSRLDTLQAAILLEKLSVYAEEIEKRQVVANRYQAALADIIKTPSVPDNMVSVWAQYTVTCGEGQDRETIMSRLKDDGIPTAVYYPRPLHQQTAYSAYPSDPEGLPHSESLSNRVFSLPMHPYMQSDDQNRVIDAVIKAIPR